jgi:hypothetical protein
MKDKNENVDSTSGAPEDVLLQQLLHLKSYETPDAIRMAKNKQNIMRQVREANSRTHWSLSDLLEVNIPWFFAEPRYGIAALFVVFATLQFLGANMQKEVRGKTGVYTRNSGMAVAGQGSDAFTNSVSYPKLPSNLDLFPDQQGDSGVMFVGRIEPKK